MKFVQLIIFSCCGEEQSKQIDIQKLHASNFFKNLVMNLHYNLTCQKKPSNVMKSNHTFLTHQNVKMLL